MPNLGGFDVIGELTVACQSDLGSAWDNNIVPHSVRSRLERLLVYSLASGWSISSRGLSLVMDVPANGVKITLPSEIQVEVANRPSKRPLFQYDRRYQNLGTDWSGAGTST